MNQLPYAQHLQLGDFTCAFPHTTPPVRSGWYKCARSNLDDSVAWRYWDAGLGLWGAPYSEPQECPMVAFKAEAFLFGFTWCGLTASGHEFASTFIRNRTDASAHLRPERRLSFARYERHQKLRVQIERTRTELAHLRDLLDGAD